MDERLEAILIEALAALDGGSSIAEVLSRYPNEAAELEPMLCAALQLTRCSDEARTVIPARQAQARAEFLAQAAAIRSQVHPLPRLARLAHRRILLSVVTALVLIAAIGSTVLGVSAGSLPGDPLYGVKRSFESIQLSFVTNPTQRAKLEDVYGERRKQEVRAVQAAKRSASVEFIGPVQATGAAEWTVSGFAVQVTTSTLIDGAPQVNDLVQVLGHTLPDGRIVADRIESQIVDLEGAVEAMNGPMWVIGGSRVLVTGDTRITGIVRQGAWAKLHARRIGDGALLALTVEFGNSGPPPTSTPEPSSTVAPRVQPTASATPKPRQDDVEPTAALEPRATTAPTEIPHPRDTSEPRETPEWTRTPHSVETPESPRPPHTPEPTERSEPTRAPRSTDRPEPTRNPPSTPNPEPIETRQPPLYP
jgi:hypothetical protein